MITTNDPYAFIRPGLHKQVGVFPFLENTLKSASLKKLRGFSMIELVIVVAITGVIAAIAVPKFADAASGRRLLAAKRTLIQDIEMAQLLSRASSKIHVVKFYVAENKYIIVEGTDIKREAVILTRDFDDDPYNLNISRTNLSGDNVVVISAFGDLSPAFSVGLIDNGTEIPITFGGVADFGVTPTITITLDEAKDADVKLVGLTK